MSNMATGHATSSNMVANRRGFTIVELLIVIVVIAVLAAITIVAYNGISNRAKASSAQSAAAQATKKVMTYAIDNSDQYPADLASIGVTDSGSTTYQYSVNNNVNPRTYCITATTSSVSYYESSTSPNPTAGACAGHGADGVVAITNLVTNPNAESVLTGFGGVNGSTVARAGAYLIDGANGVRVESPANGINDSGANIGLPSTVVAGQTRTISLKIRAVTAGTYRMSLQGTNFLGNVASAVMTAGQVSRLSATVTFAASGSLTGYVLRSSGAVASSYDIDSVMMTDGTTLHNYADGNSAGWAWTSTVNNSTSSGPPL